MPSIKVRFPAETYRLAGQTALLECFAYGKYVSFSEIIQLLSHSFNPELNLFVLVVRSQG